MHMHKYIRCGLAYAHACCGPQLHLETMYIKLNVTVALLNAAVKVFKHQIMVESSAIVISDSDDDNAVATASAEDSTANAEMFMDTAQWYESRVRFDWGPIRDAGIEVAIIRPPRQTASDIRQHCLDEIENVRRDLQVPVWKIGIATNLIMRWESYQLENFTLMRVLHISDNYGLTCMLEAALIDVYMGMQGCRNINKGGEGLRDRPPFFTYVVAARADCKKRIGA